MSGFIKTTHSNGAIIIVISISDATLAADGKPIHSLSPERNTVKIDERLRWIICYEL